MRESAEELKEIADKGGIRARLKVVQDITAAHESSPEGIDLNSRG
jgi:hypothetical protein